MFNFFGLYRYLGLIDKFWWWNSSCNPHCRWTQLAYHGVCAIMWTLSFRKRFDFHSVRNTLL